MEGHQYEEPLQLPCGANPIEYIPLTDPPLQRNELTKTWLQNFHGFGKKRGAKIEKIITIILLVALLVALITWGVFGYNHMRENSNSNLRKITELGLKYELLQQKYQRMISGNGPFKNFQVQTTKPNSSNRQKKDKFSPRLVGQKSEIQKKKNSIVISVIGDGSGIEMTAGKAIHDWKAKPSVHEGEITFLKQRFIQIEKDGLYSLQSRLFLKDNNVEGDSTLSYTISKWTFPLGATSLVSAAIPASS